MKVYINAEGNYLRIVETSSHSPCAVYYPSWGKLNDATIVDDNHNLSKIRWKCEEPVVVTSLRAFETRIITLCGK